MKSTTPVEPYQLITHYQLDNLLKNRVRFLFLDLRSEASRSQENETHPLLKDAISVLPDRVLEHLSSIGAPRDVAIVLICEDGSNSMAVLQVLGENSFMNAFIIEGGVKSLPR